jgi:CheY-like chemotaxis protein
VQNVNCSTPSDQSGVPKPTILIVDDAQTGAIALEIACSAIPGLAVLAVNSAVDAARILSSGDMPISAVVTDIRMPGMDGFELIRHIRRDPRYTATPVIVVTADTEPDTFDKCISLGANLCFPKPFSPTAVRDALEKLIYAENDSTR